MLNILQKIMIIGKVTEEYDKTLPAARFRGEVISFDDAACVECQQPCLKACPVGAIKLEQGFIVVEQKNCIFCGRCIELCENSILTQTKNYKLAEISGQLKYEGDSLRQKIIKTLGRSLHIRHLDAGSCNACDWEMAALNNPIYDLQQYGIDFVASPRHADLLMVTGAVTRNLTQALIMTYEATPAPKLVMAVGACAASASVYGATYAIGGAVNDFIPVDIYVPGCPPRPQALIYALLLALERI